MFRTILLFFGRFRNRNEAEAEVVLPKTETRDDPRQNTQVNPIEIPDDAFLWIQVRRIPYKPVGILPGKWTIAEGRLLWVWCTKTPGMI